MEEHDDEIPFARATPGELGAGRILLEKYALTQNAVFYVDEAEDWWKVLSAASEKAIMGDEVYAAGLGMIFAHAIEDSNGDPKRLLSVLGLVRSKGRPKPGLLQKWYGYMQVALIERHGFAPEEALEFAADHLSAHVDMTVERSTMQRWRKEAEDRLASVPAQKREEALRTFDQLARK